MSVIISDTLGFRFTLISSVVIALPMNNIFQYFWWQYVGLIGLSKETAARTLALLANCVHGTKVLSSCHFIHLYLSSSQLRMVISYIILKDIFLQLLWEELLQWGTGMWLVKWLFLFVLLCFCCCCWLFVCVFSVVSIQSMNPYSSVF